MLGYDVDPGGGRLILNEKEARRVREIFQLYGKVRSLSTVAAELGRRGWTTKSWKSKGGITHVGQPFKKASLRRFLTNAVYAGKVEYRGSIYPGEHTAIVEAEIWQEINAELRSGRRGRGASNRTKQNALLAGLLFCKNCERRMIATYTAKSNRRYRYYVCQGAQQSGWKSCPTKSVPANMIEQSVIMQLKTAVLSEETRAQLKIPDAAWSEFVAGDSAGFVRALVEEITYDGPEGAVSLKIGVFKGSSNESEL